MDEGHEYESSECSSGCQSGWTMYLDQSFTKVSSKLEEEEEEEEEEDQSMVSDASSGPPHFRDEDDQYFSSLPASALLKNDGKRRRVDAALRHAQKQPSSLLDDTASSPLLSKTTFSGTAYDVEDALEFSCGFSATHFKEKHGFQKHLGYLQAAPPVQPASSARPAAALPCMPFGMHFSEGQ